MMLLSTRRALVALGISLALSLLALLAWATLLSGAQAAAGPPVAQLGSVLPASASANVAGHRYCSNWDFLNNTGVPVNDLHVRLKSVKAVSDVYTGTLNPFGPPSASGYDAANDVYTMTFRGAWVGESDMVHIGFCTDAPLLRLDSQANPPPFVWTLTGTQKLPNPLFTGLEWNWPQPQHLRLRVVNEHPISITLSTLNLLDAGNILTLDDLNGGVAALLPLTLELLESPRTLAPHADSFFDVFFTPGGQTIPPDMAPLLEPNHPYVLEDDFFGDDPGDLAHLYTQALAPLIPLYLPLIRR
jgi:hypothetical protein